MVTVVKLSLFFFVVDGRAPDLLDEVGGLGVELPHVPEGGAGEGGRQGHDPAQQVHVVRRLALGVGGAVGLGGRHVLLHGRPLPVGHGLAASGLDLDGGGPRSQQLPAGE